jgi:hypothetical protein
MLLRKTFGLLLAVCLTAAIVPVHARAQDADSTPEKHGRKYKAPPDTSHIEIDVIRGSNKKPIANAAVVFHPVKDGKDAGNLEIKTDPEGKAIIDVIPTGSKVLVQVIADGFATFAQDYQIDEASRTILVTMERPRAQVSTYTDNAGKPATIQPGVQEPVRTKKPAPATPPPSSTPSTAPNSSGPAASGPSASESSASGPSAITVSSAKLASDEDPDNE